MEISANWYSGFWFSMLGWRLRKKADELAVRPKTVFEGFVYIISGIMGVVSFFAGCMSLALF